VGHLEGIADSVVGSEFRVGVNGEFTGRLYAAHHCIDQRRELVPLGLDHLVSELDRRFFHRLIISRSSVSKKTICNFFYMSGDADQPKAADARRAAALIIHRRRADVDGVTALLEEAHRSDRVTELVLAVLDLYRTAIEELRSDNGINLIASYVGQMCKLAEQASPEVGVGEMLQSARLLDAHGRGDMQGVNNVFSEAKAGDRGVYLILGLLDLLETLLPELSCEAGFDWLNRCVSTFAAEEAGDEDGNAARD
jgi:hypothetical protein